MSDLATLKTQRAQLDAEIQRIERASKGIHVAAVRQHMEQVGVTLADLGAVVPGKVKAKQKTAGTTVAPKYRDSQGNTWSGRGFKPKWLEAQLAAGATLQSFLIPV